MLYFGFGLLTFLFTIGCYVIYFHTTIRRAIKEIVNPLLIAKGMSYIDYKWPGFFSRGDFEVGNKAIKDMFKTGLNSVSVYSFIYYKDLKLDANKSITIRIDVMGLLIENVTYSNQI